MQVLDLGQMSYAKAWELQKELVDKRARDEISDTLVLVEHPAVYTCGRASVSVSEDKESESSSPDLTNPLIAAKEAILVPKLGAVPVEQVERGGKITFHGPGQLVGYPIFKLHQKDLRKYLRDLERILIQEVQACTGLVVKPGPETLFLEPGQLQTGVWIGDKKVASIGIAIRKWVTYHGFALNISTDLRYFEATEPCGFSGQIMTTLEKEWNVAERGRFDAAEVLKKLKAGIAVRFSDLSKASTTNSENQLMAVPSIAPALG